MLQPNNLTVQHRKGGQNTNDDALSRLPMNNPCFTIKKEEGNVTGELTRVSGSNEKEFWERSKEDLIGQFQHHPKNLIGQSERESPNVIQMRNYK